MGFQRLSWRQKVITRVDVGKPGSGEQPWHLANRGLSSHQLLAKSYALGWHCSCSHYSMGGNSCDPPRGLAAGLAAGQNQAAGDGEEELEGLRLY